MSEAEIFGKTLIVEDNYSTVKDAIANLVEKGITVQYWNGSGDFPETMCNARIVILDLNLTGKGDRTMGPEYYLPAAEALNKIPGPFVAILFALDFQDEDPEELLAYYEDTFGDLPGFIAEKGLSKDDELEDPGQLRKVIISAINKNKILNLILAWEQALDFAKDRGLSELVTKKIESTILRLIRILCKKRGEKSSAREFMQTMMRLVSRRIIEHKRFEEISKMILELNRQNVKEGSQTGNEDILLYNKLLFYVPDKDEDIFTGDIYEVVGKTVYERYAIVLTPSCDIIQEKTEKALICFAFPIAEEFLSDPQFPPYAIDPKIVEKMKNNASQKNVLKLMKERYILDEQKLPENLYILWNFIDSDSILGLCFDFHNVESADMKDLRKLKRLCRLDTPFIQEMQAEYTRVLSRVGTPEINRCPAKLRNG